MRYLPHQQCINYLMTEVYKWLNGLSPDLLMNDVLSVPKHLNNTRHYNLLWKAFLNLLMYLTIWWISLNVTVGYRKLKGMGLEEHIDPKLWFYRSTTMEQSSYKNNLLRNLKYEQGVGFPKTVLARYLN